MEDKNLLYVMVLALVAIVAMVALSSSPRVTTSPPMDLGMDADENTVGNARYSWSTSQSYRQVNPSAAQSPTPTRVASGLRVNSAKDTAESEGHTFIRLSR